MAVPNTQRGGRSQSNDAYTLVELAVAMLVIGALLAIAVATYLNAQKGSQEKVAQSRARAALMATRNYVSQNGVPPALAEDLETVEPSLEFTSDASARVLGKVYVRNDAGDVYIGTAANNGETCFWVKDSANAGARYARVPCSADAAEIEAAFANSW
ncbi:MAG TPA: type II secretion system protein [Acidimicrobiales bacterium]|jgi:type II secretory pathway pseudopilin PulG|nr:type II secretion system protein [Acidimicrobiales bacterium]